MNHIETTNPQNFAHLLGFKLSIPDDEQGAAGVDQPAAHGAMKGAELQAMKGVGPSIPQFESLKWIDVVKIYIEIYNWTLNINIYIYIY